MHERFLKSHKYQQPTQHAAVVSVVPAAEVMTVNEMAPEYCESDHGNKMGAPTHDL